MAIEMVKDSKGKGRASMAEYSSDDELPPPLASRMNGSGQVDGVKKSSSSKTSKHGISTSSTTAVNGSSAASSSSGHGNFRTIQATSRFPLAPMFALDSLDGVRQVLQSWIMRWVEARARRMCDITLLRCMLIPYSIAYSDTSHP